LVRTKFCVTRASVGATSHVLAEKGGRQRGRERERGKERGRVREREREEESEKEREGGGERDGGCAVTWLMRNWKKPNIIVKVPRTAIHTEPT